MTAAAFSTILASSYEIVLIESDAIGIVGVGEATLPHLRYFLRKIGLDESLFLRETRATFKLGIEFVDWARAGDVYFHPFGVFGEPQNGVRFHQCWRKFADDPAIGPLSAYSLPVQMAYSGRFQIPDDDPSRLSSKFGYAYQFDATRFAPLLRAHAESRGVRRIQDVVRGADRDPVTGNLTSVKLADGEPVAGDLFIDCSGFCGLLIGEALGVDCEDWSHWLPCDRAVAVPCESVGDPLPYTRATARTAGWQWRIPLQHRTGNGYVYSSSFTTDEQATRALMTTLEGAPLADPRTLTFTPGRRRRSWERNCVAIGLSGGFLEPLESTSIYLIQQAITHLLDLFPVETVNPPERASFNDRMDEEFERTRDFLVLHYHATERDDSALWRYVRTMEIPETLREKIALFRARGHAEPVTRGIFEEPSWLAVLNGQRITPDRYDQRVDLFPADQLKARLLAMRSEIARAVDAMPVHAATLARALA